MTEQDVGPWPTIPVTAPKWDDLDGELLEHVDDAMAAELHAFYEATLVPQLACNVSGKFPALPTVEFIAANSAAVVRRGGGIVGAWILEGDQLLYPCAVVEDITGIFRALWDATITGRDYVWGSTGNPVIMAFAQKAVRVPPSKNSPTVTEDRLEWRRS